MCYFLFGLGQGAYWEQRRHFWLIRQWMLLTCKTTQTHKSKWRRLGEVIRNVSWAAVLSLLPAPAGGQATGRSCGWLKHMLWTEQHRASKRSQKNEDGLLYTKSLLEGSNRCSRCLHIAAPAQGGVEPCTSALLQHNRSVSDSSASLHRSGRQGFWVLPAPATQQPGEHTITATPGCSGIFLVKRGPYKSKLHLLSNSPRTICAIVKSQQNAWNCNVYKCERSLAKSVRHCRLTCPSPLCEALAEADRKWDICRSRGRSSTGWFTLCRSMLAKSWNYERSTPGLLL